MNAMRAPLPFSSASAVDVLDLEADVEQAGDGRPAESGAVFERGELRPQPLGILRGPHDRRHDAERATVLLGACAAVAEAPGRSWCLFPVRFC